MTLGMPVTAPTPPSPERPDASPLLARVGRMARVGGWTWELATGEISWSDETCRLHDLPPGHRPSQREALGYFAPEARLAIQTALDQAIASGDAWDLELPLITATGRRIWVRCQGEADREPSPAGAQTVRLVGSFQDVTPQRRLWAELEGHRQRLRALYESTPALLHSVDTHGHLLAVSDLWLRHFGYTRDEVIGRPLAAFMPADSAAALIVRQLPLLWQDGGCNEQALQLRCADGQLRDVLMSATTEYDAQHQPLRALASLVDVTDDLRRQSELTRERSLRAEIEHHADELRRLLHERSEMLDVLAHEVRLPLNSASAALQSASTALEGQAAPVLRERLARAEAVISQVLGGVDNTLAAATSLAGAASVAAQDTDIDTLIAVCLADLPREARARVRIERQSSTRTALMDMSLMRLAVRNLLGNALKYSAASTPVWLRVLDVEEPPAIVFEVEDQGPGIAEGVRARLFQRGARAGQAREGTHGLGLYIVRRVLELHQGRAELARSSASGSVLRLVVPQGAD